MKTKYLVLATGALLAAAGLWFGRAAWRAHHQIVTLNVRNAPLSDVLRKIERQTRKTLRAPRGLDVRITLRVTNKPLSEVLDRIAEQAGARWFTLYAVYDSARALHALDSALAGDGTLEPAGWTKIAPNPPPMPPPDSDEPGRPPLGGVEPAGPGPAKGERRVMMFRRAGDGATLVQNGSGEVEVWSPEELVIESALNARLAGERQETAGAAAAEEVAGKVKGRWTSFLAFRKSSLGLGRMPRANPGREPAPPNPNDRFARFTPEQRVARARERARLELDDN